MDIEKVEKRLKKIFTVFDAFKEDGKITSIEKDLLLGYIRDLYEMVKDAPDSPSLPIQDIRIPEPVIQKTEISTPPPTPKEIPEPKPEVVVAKAEVIDLTPEVVVVPEPETVLPVMNGQAEVMEAKSSEVLKSVVMQSVQDEDILVVSEEKIPAVGTEMEKLFIINKAVDLSDKLAMSRIEDINKAMGINERLFNLNELFGGNSELFNATLAQLNQMINMDQAKKFLITGVASQYQWDSEKRWNKAHQFIRLISRRYQ